MVIRIETNQRYGQRFQIHIIDGPLNKIFDEYPLDLHSAVSYARELLNTINRERGTSYEIGEVLQTSISDLEANAKEDFVAARFLDDVKSEKYEPSTPGGADIKKSVIDGKEEYVLSGRGVVLFCLSSWKKDKNEKAKGVLRRYCEYICAHGRKGGAAGTGRTVQGGSGALD